MASFAKGAQVEAGMVRIVNNSNVAIKVNIPLLVILSEILTAGNVWIARSSSSGKYTAGIVVPVDAFHAGQYFSVIDIAHGIFASGKCKNLNVFKNYEVFFSETTFGTSCKDRET